MHPARLAAPHMQRQAVVVNVQTAPANGKFLYGNPINRFMTLGAIHHILPILGRSTATASGKGRNLLAYSGNSFPAFTAS